MGYFDSTQFVGGFIGKAEPTDLLLVLFNHVDGHEYIQGIVYASPNVFAVKLEKIRS